MTTHHLTCNCLECLAQFKPFRSLSRSELETLQEKKQVLHYNSGEIIVKQGSSMTQLTFIYDGLAKIYLEGLNGHNLILQLLKRGDLVIGPGIFTDYRHHFSIAAVTDCSICFIDIHNYVKVMSKNQAFAVQSYQSENFTKINALNKLICLTQKQMNGRLADALLYLHDYVYETNPFQIGISRRELADMTALSKESVSRILRQFKDEKIINLKGSRIEILNMDAVRLMSEVG